MVQGMSMSCVKYLMFVFNFVFVVCGIILIVIGAIVRNDDFTVFVDSKFVTGPIILVIVGCIIFFLAFLGCCGAVKESNCMVTMFGVLLLILFIIEIAGGITAYSHKNEFEGFLKKNMNSSIAQQKKDSEIVWNEMQVKWSCCGVEGPEDYFNNNVTKLPKSCCPKAEKDCEEDKAFTRGCFDSLFNALKSKLSMVGGAAIGVGVVELVGCMFAFCLASAIKREH